jgi:CRP/FNR family transcriptional regulator, cyclic AMP receptor protein
VAIESLDWFAMNRVPRQFDYADLLVGTPGICRQTVTADTTVFRQGEPADFIYYLVSGRIKLSAVSARGKEAIVAVLESDEIFGAHCLLGYGARRMTAAALVTSDIIKIREDVARSLIDQNVGFDEFLIERLIKGALRIEEQLLDQMFNSSEKRLARTLLLLANYGKKDTPDITIPKLSQEMLAEMVGSTRPRINQFMNKFRKLGYIDYDNATITVHHSLLTVLLSDAKENAYPLERGGDH